ncbi:unnamed protein product [Heterobilharzia americana]|nr:unnamed protein product [Heterobilharzia americana]
MTVIFMKKDSYNMYALLILQLIFNYDTVNSWNVYGFLESQIPEQVHIALGEKPSTISVTWVTQENTESSTVLYGTERLNMKSTGYVKEFVDGGREQRVMYIHRVIITDLIGNTLYNYKCGSMDGWSPVLQFRALPSHPYWSPRLAVYGDMGAVNATVLPELIHEVNELDNFDMILHVGDFAYNMDSDNGRVGDKFMRNIQPIASRVPYMTCVGNHEAAYNFSNYKARFSMPEEMENPNFIVSTELYYFLFYGWESVVAQYDWLIRDLNEANKPENRKIHPWIIVMGHRPMYCSNNFDPMHCDFVDNIIRTGFAVTHHWQYKKYILGLEDLFYKNGVDLIVAGHEHSYERFWPVYNRTVCNSTTSRNPYENPNAPVHIVSGAAGSDEGKDAFLDGGKPWSAFRSNDFGFTRMVVHNYTHLEIEQVSVEKERTGEVIDSFTIIKEKHGPGLYTCHNPDTQHKNIFENM